MKRASSSSSPDLRGLAAATVVIGVVVWILVTRDTYQSFSHDEFWKLDRAFADPAAVYAEDGFHVYTTSATHCVPGNCPVYWVPHFATKDLGRPGSISGDAMPDLPAWVDPNDRAIWAPSVAFINGAFVMYFSATSAVDPFVGMKCLGVAVSPGPAGPFAPLPDPLRCSPGWWNVDPYVVADGLGALFLLWREDDAANVTGKIVAAQLTADGMAFAPTAGAVLVLGQYPWEEGYPEAPEQVAPDDATSTDRQLPGAAVASPAGIGPVENPAMAQHPETGEWLLTWSANRWETRDYATGLAVCASPLGPCTTVSQEEPWLRSSSDATVKTSADFGGCGGLSFVGAPDGRLFAVFHAYRGDGALPEADRVGWIYEVTSDRDSYALTEFE